MGISEKEYRAMMIRAGAPAEPKTQRAGGAKPKTRANPFAVGKFIQNYTALDPDHRCIYCGVPTIVGPKACFACEKRLGTGYPWRCLAIDPSVQNLGYAVLDASGSDFKTVDGGRWHPSQKAGGADRFVQIAAFTRAIIEHFIPTDVVIEMPHPHQAMDRGEKRSFKPLMIYSVGAGFVAGVAASLNRRLWRPDAKQWKDSGSKADTAQQVELVLGAKHRSPDEIDAAGLALWWYTRMRPWLTPATTSICR